MVATSSRHGRFRVSLPLSWMKTRALSGFTGRCVVYYTCKSLHIFSRVILMGKCEHRGKSTIDDVTTFSSFFFFAVVYIWLKFKIFNQTEFVKFLWYIKVLQELQRHLFKVSLLSPKGSLPCSQKMNKTRTTINYKKLKSALFTRLMATGRNNCRSVRWK